MAIVIEASPEIGPELLAYLAAQGLAPTVPEKRNLDFTDPQVMQIILTLSSAGLAEIVRFALARYLPDGSGTERALAALKELTIVIDGEKVPIERLAKPGEIEKIVRERDEI